MGIVFGGYNIVRRLFYSLYNGIVSRIMNSDGRWSWRLKKQQKEKQKKKNSDNFYAVKNGIR